MTVHDSPPPRTRTRPRGFTLIELVVVVIILAVLAAVAGLTYDRFVSQTRDASLWATARQVDKALVAASTRDDATPGAVLAAAPGGDLASHLQVSGDDLTLTPGPGATPATLRVTVGSRSLCLTLGDRPGQASTIADDPAGCSAASPEPPAMPGPVASALTAVAVSSTGTVTGRGVAVLADGSSVVTGNFSGTATFGSTTLTSAGSQDVFVAKLTSAGTWVWAARAGSTGTDYGYGIALDGTGTPVVIGSFVYTATFGATSVTSAGGTDVFVAKLTSTGTWAWAARGGGTGADRGFGVALDGTGDAVLTGDFSGTGTFGATSVTSAGGTDVFVAKLTSTGTWAWAARAGSPGNDYGYGMVLDGAGNPVLSGVFVGTATFGATSVTSAGGTDVFVAKLASTGTWAWATSAGSIGADYGDRVALDGTGSPVLSGYFSGSATFGATTVSSAGGDDVFVAKLTPTGTWAWATSAGSTGGDYGRGMALDGTGNAVLTGDFSGTATFGATSVTSTGGTDVFVAKLTPTGTWAWATRAGSPGNDYGYGITLDGAGNPVVIGVFVGTATFGATTLTSSGTSGFVAGWNADGSPTS